MQKPLQNLKNFIKSLYIRKCFGYELIKEHIQGKNGLEVGGPSAIFSKGNIIPLYNIVGKLDNCNFATETTWSSFGSEGDTYKYYPQAEPGYQFIAEATSMRMVKTEVYDCVLASHVLEHVANPLKAVAEWKRILKNNGVILMVLPYKDRTFDHKRPVTTFEHLEEDYKNDVTEADLTHFDEILTLHDIKRDPGAGSFEKFYARSLKNQQNRCFHHHVFSPELLVQICNYFFLKVIHIAMEPPYHIIVIAEKVDSVYSDSVCAANELFVNSDAEWRKFNRLKYRQ